jgi:hypothetical protein
MSSAMHILSVSTIILVVIELLIFSGLWLDIAYINNGSLLIAHTLIAFISSYWLSSKWKQAMPERKIIWFILFNFIFFIPVTGAIILWMFSIRKSLRQTTSEAKRIIEEKEQAQKNEQIHYFSAPKHHHISHAKQTRDLLSTLDDDSYLKLLVSTRHLPDKEAYALLKEALSSPFESARLMAFSLKGKLEERLQSELQQKISILEQTTSISNTADLHLSIARDYIHLLDIGVLSENNEVLLGKARKHCIKAIRLNNKSAYAFQALSKILKHQGRNKQAQRAQIKAVDLGLPLDRLYTT